MRIFTSKLVAWVFMGAVFLVLISILLPTDLFGSRHNKWRYQCQSNLKQIALALRQYGADNDGRFPSLQTVAGWRNGVSYYVKNDAIFQCPGADGDRAPRGTDYLFNARLSGAANADLSDAALTVSLGDGYSTTDPRVALSQMPRSWIDDPKSPAKRHLDGLNVAFADGHVKWLRPEKLTTQQPQQNHVSFALR